MKHNANWIGIDRVELERILNEAKMGIEQIADSFGVSVPTISRRMRLWGLHSKKGRGSPMEKNYFWNGGTRLDDDGYLYRKSPGHPFATKGGYVREHRLVMEKHLGRYLHPLEVVHHKDRNRQNNALNNLQLFPRNSEHLRHELTGKRPNYTPDGLRRMRENALRVNRRRYSSSRKASKSDAAPSQ